MLACTFNVFCEKSSERERVLEIAYGESAADLPAFEYRSFGLSA